MRVIIFAALLLISQISQAQILTGNDLNTWAAGDDRTQLPNAKNTDYVDSAMLAGYVRGVVDASISVLCMPGNVTVGQSLAIVKKYVRDHPEKWAWNAIWLVNVALLEAFPCARK